ncbi:WD40 repeat domain-containing protein [Nonomuraea helvata]|uniref:WD40 repeat domain-containing protein n=1 Tax=Nonomuraea helvata TaxID=37484 RepID=A0ABV5SJE2_9ACTN
MRHPSVTAALLASAVIGGLGLTPGAAHAQAGTPAARAAWIKSCHDKKDDTDYPCGHWKLVMRDGRQVVVRDAAGSKVGAKDETAAFAISADGRVLAYQRARDHRLVVQPVTGGPAKLLPKSAGAVNLSVMLSPKGDRVMIDYGNEPVSRPIKVITVATGQTTTLPLGDSMLGFSGDGDEVLTSRDLSDNTTRLAAYRLGGGSIKRTPPQVVYGAEALALAPDGRTVAAFIAGNADRKKPPRVRTYDLESGELSAGADLPLTPDTEAETAWWGPDGRIRATVRRGDDGEAAVVRVLTVDPQSGKATQTDAYTISNTKFEHVEAGK